MSAAKEVAQPGRPRRVETEAAINAATRELLTEVGYGSLTIEEVARRAGVGKPTVYRRHDSKAALVAAALMETLEAANPDVPDTGDVAADAAQLLGNLARALATDFGTAVTEIVSPAARETHLAELFTTVTEQRRELIRQIMQRAADEQRLRAGDAEVAIDLALGAIYFRHLISHDIIDDDFIASVVASIIRPSGRTREQQGKGKR